MHSQEIEGMYLYACLPACLLTSGLKPPYLCELTNACCYLSPLWGFGECVFGVAIHLPPLWGYVS